jgi:hypothetical protein
LPRRCFEDNFELVNWFMFLDRGLQSQLREDSARQQMLLTSGRATCASPIQQDRKTRLLTAFPQPNENSPSLNSPNVVRQEGIQYEVDYTCYGGVALGGIPA